MVSTILDSPLVVEFGLQGQIQKNPNVYPNVDDQTTVENQGVYNTEETALPTNQNSQGLGFNFTVSKETWLFLLKEIVASGIETIKNHEVFGSSE